MNNEKQIAQHAHRIPSLDGIRAMAVWMVILLHALQRSGGNSHPIIATLIALVPDGVGIFFVLSGFLITSLLLGEYDATGTISMKAFYIRRFFRIIPPAYTYILFVLIFFPLAHFAIHWNSLVSAILFYRDYAPGVNFWATEHYWTLAVEEQFYLLWPIILLWGLRYGGRKRAAKIAFIGIILAPIFRFSGYLANIYLFDHKLPIDMMFQDRMDALMCGALLGLLAGTTVFECWFNRVSKFWFLCFAYTFIISGLCTIWIGVDFQASLGLTINSVAIMIWLYWLSQHPGSLLGRLLNTKLFTAMGVLSYSAYLWQMFFLHSANTTFVGVMPWAVIWVWVPAWLSYRLIEKPSLKLRKYTMSLVFAEKA